MSLIPLLLAYTDSSLSYHRDLMDPIHLLSCLNSPRGSITLGIKPEFTMRAPHDLCLSLSIVFSCHTLTLSAPAPLRPDLSDSSPNVPNCSLPLGLPLLWNVFPPISVFLGP